MSRGSPRRMSLYRQTPNQSGIVRTRWRAPCALIAPLRNAVRRSRSPSQTLTTVRTFELWNRTRKRDRWGQRRQQARPVGEWLEVEAPHLRVVSESLWRAVQARREERRARYLAATGGKCFGRPRRDVDSKYLLSGFARCASCGGGMCVRSRSHGGHRVYLYGCTTFWKRGRTVCANSLEIRMGDADAAVLSAVGGAMLAPDVGDEVVAGVLAVLRPDRVDQARLDRTDPSRYFDGLEADDPNRLQVMQIIRSIWADIGAFNKDWQTSVADWVELEAWTSLPQKPVRARNRLRRTWLLELGRDYYRWTTEMIRQQDPHRGNDPWFRRTQVTT